MLLGVHCNGAAAVVLADDFCRCFWCVVFVAVAAVNIALLLALSIVVASRVVLPSLLTRVDGGALLLVMPLFLVAVVVGDAGDT